MADISKITVNNITYNIKDSVARDHIANRLNPHNVTKAQVGLGNVDNTSDANKAVFESRLLWGGTNIAGDISPIDAAMSSCHSANRIAFAKPDGIKIEYSTDGGSTYTDYGASDSTKIKLVSGLGTKLTVGKHTTYSDVTTNDRLRITVNASNCGFYTALKTVLINVSTEGAGNCTVTVEKSNKGSEDTWSTVETYSVTGWSGWNSIPVNCVFGGGTHQTGNWANLRFTFKIGLKGSNTSNSNALQVINLEMYGTTWWGYNSNLAHTGHLYSYDENQNATFPAQITAKQFNGTATNASKVNNHTVNSDVPSGAKFTDTTYSAATTSTDGLMSKADKAKLDGITSTYATKSELSSHSQNTSNPHEVTASQVGALPLSGGSLTGKLTAPSIETGTSEVNYFQTKKMRGEGNADTYYHAIDFGYKGHDQVDFYEYGGKYVFHQHTAAAQSSGDTVIGEINSNGFVGKVNGHTINADVPAGAKFTDTTYSNATSSADGLMSKSDKAKLDGIDPSAITTNIDNLQKWKLDEEILVSPSAS